MKEIERKFLVKKMPDLKGVEFEEQERYFLETGDNEKRITRTNEKYFYEEKSNSSGLSTDKAVGIITKKDFEKLKLLAIKSLVRKSYILSTDPEVSIKVYGGDYEGLIRAEFEFNSEEEASNFVVPEWVGKEITETEIGRDGKLINLNRSAFLREYNLLTHER